jgi:hypothetical protein
MPMPCVALEQAAQVSMTKWFTFLSVILVCLSTPVLSGPATA